MQLTRPDGNQPLAGLKVTAPPGFSATLKGVPYCSDAAIAQLNDAGYSGQAETASSACPSASLIGTAIAGAGAGERPVYVPGKVYLAGPYNGAPLSLEVVIPAVSGPYDLGNVAVRAAIGVNPITAQVTALSDPIPQILEGIPLRARSIEINLNRQNFALNPTNCDPLSIGATISGAEGAQAGLNANFQVANCSELPFRPKLALKLKGATKRTGTPALVATLTTGPGEANIANIQATLPHSEFLDNGHLEEPCTRAIFAQGSVPGEHCPAGSRIGFARAATPLLDKPLEGPVYLRSSSHKLPDIVAALHGQIDIELDGRVSSYRQRLRTTFSTVPDAPVSKFTLALDGGRKGLLENSADLCGHIRRASVQITGQNGKQANQSPVLSIPCGKGRKNTHGSARAHR
jgi:hypothetical protein